MVMKLNKSIFRIMKENWGQYLGMLFMVTLSVFLFVGLNLTAKNLKYNKEKYITNHVQEDLEFYTKDKVKDIRKIEEEFNLLMDETLVKEFKNKDKKVRVFTPNDKVNIPAVLKGKMPSKGEIALDPSFAKANNLNIGDVYNLGDNSYKISGYIALPNYAYILEKDSDIINNAKQFGLGVLSKDDLKDGTYLYSVKYNNKSKNIYEQSKPLKKYLIENNNIILDLSYAKQNVKISTLQIEVMAITAYSIILPTIILLITVVLISIIIGRMIKNEMANIGTLFALGYRRKEIIAHYMNYPIILSVVGGTIGGIAGFLAQKPLFDLFLTYFPIPIEKMSYSPIFLAIGILYSIVFLGIGSYISINSILKASPVSLMKNEGKIKKPSKFEQKLNLEKLKFKTKFSIREQLRSKSRIAFLVIGITTATIFLMYGFVAKSSIDYMISQEGNDVFDYGIKYILKSPSTDKPPQGGESVSGMKFEIKENSSDKLELIGAQENSQIVNLKDKKGNKIEIDDSKYIISSLLAKKKNIKVGDNVKFFDSIEDKQYSVKITDIAYTDAGDYIFTSLNNFNNLMGLEKGSYNAILAKSSINIDNNLVYITKTPSSLTDKLGEYMTLMKIFILGISAVAFVIGVIIVYVVTSITLDENKNHIALMKVFGYKKKEVNSLMLNGSRIYVILGYLIGVPAGYITISIIFLVFDALDLTMVTHLDFSYIVAGFVIILLTFEVSKYVCSKKIEKIALAEALKTQKE